jgi:hypothetical protein
MNCIERTATLYPSLNDTLYRKDNLIFRETFLWLRGKVCLCALFLLDTVQGEVLQSDFLLDFNAMRRKLL